MKNKNEFKKIEKILYDYKYIDNKLDVFRFKLEHIKNDVNISSIDYSKDKISSTNALSFLELMHNYEFSKFNVHMNHTIVQSEVSSLNKFLPINVDPLKRNLFIDVAKKRQIEMSTYIELCKSTINELYYSFDEYPEYSTGKSI